MLRMSARFAALIACLAIAPVAAQEQDQGQKPQPQSEVVASGLKFPWSLAFAPNGDMLIVEKQGGVRIFRDGRLLEEAIPGGPENVYVNADSGLHDIALDPDFARNRTVYIAFAEGEEDANRLAVWRGRLVGDAFQNGRVIFRASPDKAGAGHPGGRIAFLDDGTFLLSVGDGYEYADAAQDLGSHLGKVLRLDRNGQAPADNPFYGDNNAAPEIWTYGHRNIQGLIVDEETGGVWAHEHGPRGGDEINLLEAGANFGWPITTNGIDYSGQIVSELAHAPDVVSPKIVWSPSIAPSGLAVYRGDEFADWNGHFLVGALAAREIIRARSNKGGRTIRQMGFLLREMGARIRDVRVGPDGMIYALTDEADGKLIRICNGCAPAGN